MPSKIKNLTFKEFIEYYNVCPICKGQNKLLCSSPHKKIKSSILNYDVKVYSDYVLFENYSFSEVSTFKITINNNTELLESNIATLVFYCKNNCFYLRSNLLTIQNNYLNPICIDRIDLNFILGQDFFVFTQFDSMSCSNFFFNSKEVENAGFYIKDEINEGFIHELIDFGEALQLLS